MSYFTSFNTISCCYFARVMYSDLAYVWLRLLQVATSPSLLLYTPRDNKMTKKKKKRRFMSRYYQASSFPRYYHFVESFLLPYLLSVVCKRCRGSLGLTWEFHPSTSTALTIHELEEESGSFLSGIIFRLFRCLSVSYAIIYIIIEGNK